MALGSRQRVLIVGLGSSGLAAARLAAADGSRVRVTDKRTSDQLGDALAALPRDAETFLGGHPEECLDGVSLVLTAVCLATVFTGVSLLLITSFLAPPFAGTLLLLTAVFVATVFLAGIFVVVFFLLSGVMMVSCW